MARTDALTSPWHELAFIPRLPPIKPAHVLQLSQQFLTFVRSITKHSSTNLLGTNMPPPHSPPTSIFSPTHSPPLLFHRCPPARAPPSSEPQARWLFQSPTRSRPSLASTTAAGPAGSCLSRRAPLCSCTSESRTTGGRGGTTRWTGWCPTST